MLNIMFRLEEVGVAIVEHVGGAELHHLARLLCILPWDSSQQPTAPCLKAVR